MTGAPETRVARIRAALVAALAPTELDVSDDSHAHAGHAGALTGKGHFSVRIVAPCFAGVAPLKRHRMVYAAVDELMNSDIHALSIDARAPGQS
ncbi:MAG: BolA family transcriptional regulator [Gammaproteobacteria bacterium]|nr:BolA family transcriptional regulator [Gammaproteobacteria bacterium]